MTELTIALTCPRGLEKILSGEIQKYTGKNSITDKGFVGLSDATLEDVYRLNLWTRTAARVLLLLKKSTIRNEKDIYKAAVQVAWHDFFSSNQTFKVNITGQGAKVKSLNFAALLVKDAICDCFRSIDGIRPSVDKANPDIRIHVILTDKELFLYLDTSGEALFKRGYRSHTAEAPLRENLAAGLLLLSGYDGSQTMMDPMCGSGTIAIEAALIATNRAPGLLRNFAFERFKHFPADLWQQIRNEAFAKCQKAQRIIFANDKNKKVLNIAQENAKRAGVDEIIQFSHSDFVHKIIQNEHAGILITNPPYGERLGELASIRSEYPLWGTHLKHNFTGWLAGFFTADKELPRNIHLLPKRKIPLYNGELDCRLYLFDMVSGSNRKNNKN